MAKNKSKSVSVEVSVDPDELGVLSRHKVLMANDQEYRDRALTPPGGKAPGEDGKPESPVPDSSGIPAGALVAAAS